MVSNVRCIAMNGICAG